MGTLYIVSTPIGNMKDITLRAIRILGEVDVIACEDTRKTGMLLVRLNISKKQLISYYQENELKRIPQIIQFLKENKNVALVSNAGTPTISDPGFKLVRECLNHKIKVEAIPGPSAILTALVVSGFPTDKFLFLGYLPKKESKRINLLKKCKEIRFSCTIIIYESPYRVIKLLKEIEEIFGNIQVIAANELTKKFEKIYRGKVSEILNEFQSKAPRGEYTIVIHQE